MITTSLPHASPAAYLAKPFAVEGQHSRPQHLECRSRIGVGGQSAKCHWLPVGHGSVPIRPASHQSTTVQIDVAGGAASQETAMAMLLLALLAGVATGLNVRSDEARLKAGTDPATLELFQNGVNFASHSSDLFDGLGTDRLRALIAFWSRSSQIPEVAKQIRGSDLSALVAGDTTGTRLAAALPLLNQLPIEVLEGLDDLAMARVASMASFDRRRLGKISGAKQEALLNTGHLAPELVGALSLDVLRTVIESNECQRLGSVFFENLPDVLAPQITSTCLGRVRAPSTGLVLPPRAVSKISPEVLYSVDPRTLGTPVYKSMTAKQLQVHLLSMTPSAGQLKAVPSGTLSTALKTLISKSPEQMTSRVELIRNCPPSVMSAFTKAFWQDASGEVEWQLSSAQLVALPGDAFSAANPQMLFNLRITASHPSHAGHARLEEIVASLGKLERPDGLHPCAIPAGLLDFMRPKIYSKLTAACIQAMDPEMMQKFNDSAKLNALSQPAVAALTSAHIAAIPPASINDSSRLFLTKLFKAAVTQFGAADPDVLACSGLSAEHFDGTRAGSIWTEMTYECLSVMDNAVLKGLRSESFGLIKPEVIAKMRIPVDDETSGVETMTELIKKMRPQQIQVLGGQEKEEDKNGGAAATATAPEEDDAVHPCNGIKLYWDSIGGGDNRAATKKIPPKCFALLDVSTYEGMPEGALSQMHERILLHIHDEDRMGKIPAVAFVGLSQKQLAHLDPRAARGLEADQVIAMGRTGSTQYLSAEAIGNFSSATLEACLREGLKLPSNALSKVTADKLPDGRIIAELGEKLTPLQWNALVAGLSEDERAASNPCAGFKFEDLGWSKHTRTFWKGINAHCLAALTFLDQLTAKELEPVPDAAFAHLTSSQRAAVAQRLPAEAAWKLEISGDCSRYTVETFSKLTAEEIELLSDKCLQAIPAKVVEGVKGVRGSPVREHHIPTRALETWRPEQLRATHRLEGDLSSLSGLTHGAGCETITQEQIDGGLNLGSLSKVCVTHLDPGIFKKLPAAKINQLSRQHWESALSKAHIGAIPEKVLLELDNLQYVGAKYRGNPSLHPCYGLSASTMTRLDPVRQDQVQQTCRKLLGKRPPTRGWMRRFLFLWGTRWYVILLGGVTLPMMAVVGYYIYRRLYRGVEPSEAMSIE